MRARREQLGLSLRELARRSEGAVGHSTVAQVETGELNATLGTLSSIARLLGMEIDVRLLPAGEGLSPERQALLEALGRVLDKLQDRDVRALLAQLEAYERESDGAQKRSNR